MDLIVNLAGSTGWDRREPCNLCSYSLFSETINHERRLWSNSFHNLDKLVHAIAATIAIVIPDACIVKKEDI
jgi:hypothetical protein